MLIVQQTFPLKICCSQTWRRRRRRNYYIC